MQRLFSFDLRGVEKRIRKSLARDGVCWCIQCQEPIPPGKAGRRCKRCREPQQDIPTGELDVTTQHPLKPSSI